MEFKDFSDLVHKVNLALGGFCNQFQYKRKELIGAGRTAGNDELFGNVKKDDGWAINKGGGIEVQYHIAFDEETYKVRYGLGFNTQYVPFATNSISPQELMKPFMMAFLQKESDIHEKLPEYNFIYGNRDQLVNPGFNQYTLFGKEISIAENEEMFIFNDDDFNSMLEDLKKQFPVYIEIFETRNNIIKMEKELSPIIDLLKYKKQIILQGPPGTGKTKKAKEIAKEIAIPLEINEGIIESFIKQGITVTSKYDLIPYVVISVNESRVTLQLTNGRTESRSYSQIILAYSNLVKKIPLQGGDAYQTAIAKFILKQLEEELIEIVQFHPSYSYEDFVRGISAQASDDGKNISYSAENKLLAKLAERANDNYINSLKSNSLISREKWVAGQFERFLQEEISEKLDTHGFIKLTNKVNIINIENGLLRYKGETGWSKNGSRLRFKDIIQSYLDGNTSRQDIVDNPRLPKVAKYHASQYFAVLKMFQDFLEKNKLTFTEQSSFKTPLKNFVLIIDEINRANLSSVLGELIYALEYRNEPVESMYEIDEDNKLVLPPNLYIVGTMNTADRSVGHIDYAIRRRFAFVDVLPKDLSAELGDDFKTVEFEKVKTLFFSKEPKHLSDDFKPEDVCLGHSYFIQQYEKNKNGSDDKARPIDFRMRLKYEIIPILEEYIKDGVLKESSTKTVDELKEQCQ